MGSEHLSAVVPVGLVAVILAGVVAGGDVHTGLAAQLADGEGDLGRGAQALEEVHLDAVGREDVSHALGEHASVVTAVVAYYHRALLAREGFKDVVGEALRGHAHDILVHAVGAGSHDAAQTAGAELQVLVEGVDERRLVVSIEHLLYFTAGLLVEGGSEPLLCTCGALGNELCVVFHLLVRF